MKKDKQLNVLALLIDGKYKVINDKVYGKKKTPLIGNKLHSGYTQFTFPNRLVVYKHIVVYLANYGEYPEGLKIDHIDNDNTNDLPNNLRAGTQIDNVHNSINSRCEGVKFKTIRDCEIKQIRELLSKNVSQSLIAKSLGLRRLAVRYIVKQIEKGVKLKYELP